jgi:hypothetical protein
MRAAIASGVWLLEPTPVFVALVTYCTSRTMQIMGIKKPATTAAMSYFGVLITDSFSLCASLIIPLSAIFETGDDRCMNQVFCPKDSMGKPFANLSIIDAKWSIWNE